MSYTTSPIPGYTFEEIKNLVKQNKDVPSFELLEPLTDLLEPMRDALRKTQKEHDDLKKRYQKLNDKYIALLEQIVDGYR